MDKSNTRALLLGIQEESRTIRESLEDFSKKAFCMAKPQAAGINLQLLKLLERVNNNVANLTDITERLLDSR